MPLYLRGLKAWVSCEGEELPQHQVRSEGDNSITCYIPSEAGKKFVVHYANDGYAGDLLATILVDGRKADACCTLKASLLTGNSKFRGVLGDGVLRPFVFASVQTHEDYDGISAHDISRLGMLELRLHRTVVRPDLHHGGLAKPAFQTFGSVSEKTKLAGFHCTTLGEPIGVKASCTAQHDPIDARRNPFTVHTFCLSVPRICAAIHKALLQARGISPSDQKGQVKLGHEVERKVKKRAETPQKDAGGRTKRQRVVAQAKAETVDGSNSGHASSSDAERIRLLDQALKASQDVLRNIWAELESLKSKNSGSSSACKGEQRPSSIRLGPHNGEMIDLTED